MAVLFLAGPLAAAGPAAAVTSTDWPAYLDGPAHASYNGADAAITPANAGILQKAWHFVGDKATMPGQPGPGYLASPTVAGGAVFIGSATGWFYKLDATTGAVLHKIFVGFRPKLTCGARGVLATAAVAVDPSDSQDTVYVAAPDGYLYALRAADLSVKWKSVIAIPSSTQSDYFQWSSPTVANGKIYVGISSDCDNPLVRGGVAGFDQATGTRFATFYSVPSGVTGGSVWSTVAVDPQGYVYATTGNPQPKATQLYYTEAIVKLDPATLTPIAYFTVPKAQRTGDGDFGASPTIFGSFIGACNKNGIYYALDRSTMTLAWDHRIGAKSSSTTQASCLAAAAFDGTSLYMAGTATTIGGKSYRGSIMKINPSTGTFGWHTGLPNAVVGAPAMSAGGVISAGTYDTSTTPNAEYLVNAASGKILRTLYKSYDFAQGVFAGGWLYTANGTGVYGWKP
jgi:outer membrane protein assembly factor BamB